MENDKNNLQIELSEKNEKLQIQHDLLDKNTRELTKLQSDLNNLKNREREINETINRIPQDKIQEASKALKNHGLKGYIIWPGIFIII